MANNRAPHQDSKTAQAWKKADEGKEWIDAHSAYSETAPQEAAKAPVDTTKSWANVDWEEARIKYAQASIDAEQRIVEGDAKKVLLDKQAANWEWFYEHNKNNFFKNRNYLTAEFPELTEGSISSTSKPVVMEVGCGVGNSLFPLVEANPEKFFYAMDCSESAIDIIHKNENYDTKRCKAFVCDIVTQEIPEDIVKPHSVDIITLIFALSAIPPDKMKSVLEKLNKVLKPGGLIILKDYGLYDLTQMRFIKRKDSKMGENAYVRGDGTFTYYFALDDAKKLFTSAGFTTEEQLRFDTRLLLNRKRKLKMYRVWIRAKFRTPKLVPKE